MSATKTIVALIAITAGSASADSETLPLQELSLQEDSAREAREAAREVFEAHKAAWEAVAIRMECTLSDIDSFSPTGCLERPSPYVSYTKDGQIDEIYIPEHFSDQEEADFHRAAEKGSKIYVRLGDRSDHLDALIDAQVRSVQTTPSTKICREDTFGGDPRLSCLSNR